MRFVGISISFRYIISVAFRSHFGITPVSFRYHFTRISVAIFSHDTAFFPLMTCMNSELWPEIPSHFRKDDQSPSLWKVIGFAVTKSLWRSGTNDCPLNSRFSKKNLSVQIHDGYSSCKKEYYFPLCRVRCHLNIYSSTGKRSLLPAT